MILRNPTRDSPRAVPLESRSSDASWLTHAGIAILLALLSILATRHIWQQGVTSTADMLMGVYRVFELEQAVAAGVPYPRIGASLNFGYGSPLFQFYPPLVSYGALVLHYLGLGFIDASKGMFVLSIFAGSVGIYWFAHALFASVAAASVSAAAYLFSPYLLLIVFERGAAAESLALAIVPWVFFTCYRALDRQDSRSPLYAGAALALLVLAHNITALFVLPAVLLFSLAVAIDKARLQRLSGLVVGMLLGLGISAFYWMPAIGELEFTLAEKRMLFGNSEVASNMAGWQELLQTNLFFDYWGETKFRLSWWQALLGVVATLFIPLQRRNLRVPLGALAAIGIIGMLMQLGISRHFWDTVPLVKFIQFAWRLLGLVSCSASVLIGSLVLLPFWRATSARWVAIFLVIVPMILAGRNLRMSEDSPWYPIEEAGIGLPDLFERGRTGFSLFTDYSPLGPEVLVWDLSHSRADDAFVPESLEQPPEIVVSRVIYDRLHLEVRASHPFRLRAHRLFFPGWQVYADGQPVETFTEGEFSLATADMPAGEYAAAIDFVQTPLRHAADIISIVALCLWIGALLVPLFVGARARTAIVIAIVALGAILYARPWSRARVTPTAYAANFEDKLKLLGYHLPGTKWHPGEVIALRLYWLSQTLLDDNRVFLHLVPLDDSGLVAQFDSDPMLDYSRMSTWNPGEIVDDLYLMNLDDAIPPGQYLLLMGVYQFDPLRNLEVLDAPETLPGERVVLGQIEVLAGE